MIEMLLFNLTLNRKSVLPSLPLEGALTLERPQSLAAFPILGGTPQVQVAAVGVRTCTVALELHGPRGQAFYEREILPAYGSAPDFSPHLLRLAWGPSAAKHSFTGRPVGQPPTRIQLGATFGQIFLHTFELTLTEMQNTAPKVFNPQTNQVVNPATRTYRAVAGDTLGAVSRRFNVGLEAIYAANGNTALPWALSPGFLLNIP